MIRTGNGVDQSVKKCGNDQCQQCGVLFHNFQYSFMFSQMVLNIYFVAVAVKLQCGNIYLCDLKKRKKN